MPVNRKNIHPDALKALSKACEDSNLRPVIVQVLGNAPDSKGFHAADGHYTDADGKKIPYCGAIDFSTRQNARLVKEGTPAAMTEKRIKWFLFHLAQNGYVGWYRRPSQGFEAVHLHVVFVGVALKPQLRSQVHDFLNGKDGLRGHRKEEFWLASDELDAELRALFLKHNPA